MVATILTGVYFIGTAPNNSPLGHIVYSAYDYAVSETLGVKVDYKKSLLTLIEERDQKLKTNDGKEIVLNQPKLDSLVEKCTNAFAEIHRPIVKTQTAKTAIIRAHLGGEEQPVGTTFSSETYYYIKEEHESVRPEELSGYVSSYNRNTFKGRIFIPSEERPITFELKEECQDFDSIEVVARSLYLNAVGNNSDPDALIYFRAFLIRSRSGQLKSLKVVEVSSRKPS